MPKIKEFINKKNLFLLTSFNTKNLDIIKIYFIFVLSNLKQRYNIKIGG